MNSTLQASALLNVKRGASCYVYDLDDVLGAAEELRSYVPIGSELYYSLKANPHPAVAGVLAGAGFRAEVSSIGELDQARRAGFAAADMIYTGPAKTEHDLRCAISGGVRMFSCESIQELRRLNDQQFGTSESPRVLLRVNGAETRNAGRLRMANTASQFGLAPDDLEQALADVRTACVVGMHFYTFSNADDAEALIDEHLFNLSAAHRLAERFGISLDLLDLGGGFASPYARPGTRPDYRTLRPALETAVNRLGMTTTTLAFESGRFLVGGSGSLLTEVIDVKKSRSKTYVVLASGINHLGGMSGLRRLPPASAVFESLTPSAAEQEVVTLVGPLCTPQDILSGQSMMPTPQVGDVLRVPNVGAYGLTASLIGFLGHDAPVEVAVRGGKVITVSRLRLTRQEEKLEALTDSPQDIARGLGSRIARDVTSVDASLRLPETSLEVLRKSRLLGLLVPRSYGGLGGDLQDLAEVAAILGSGSVVTAMSWAVHCQQVDAVVRFGPADLRQRVLPAIAEGDCYLGSANFERRTDGELLISSDGSAGEVARWWLKRDPPILTGNTLADAYLVPRPSAPGTAPGRSTLVWADRATLAVNGAAVSDGKRTQGGEGIVPEVRDLLNRSAAIGDEGDLQVVVVESLMPVGHLGWAAAWLGYARRLLARVSASECIQSNSEASAVRPDVVQAKLAAVRTKLQLVSAYLWHIVTELSDLRSSGKRLGESTTQIHLNTVKMLGLTFIYEAIDECLGLFDAGGGCTRREDARLKTLLGDLRAANLKQSNGWSHADPSVDLVASAGFEW